MPARSERFQATPQLGRIVNVAAASDHVRRLAKSLPKRTTIGWQRTVLLVLGGAILAYGVTGGGRGRAGAAGDHCPEAADGFRSVPPEIHRMSRAPLRVETPGATDRTGLRTRQAVSDPANDAIFHVPEIDGEKSTDVVDEVEPQRHRRNGRSEFPVIGAPDGSKISRGRVNSLPDPREFFPGVARNRPNIVARQPAPREESTPWTPARSAPALQRETITERSFYRAEAQTQKTSAVSSAAEPASPYPHTDPATYRDPQYVIPSIANRPSRPSR